MADKEFSEKLKLMRKNAGYKQKDVYEHFNIPQSTFASWENGISEPSGEMLIKLCKFYKSDLLDFSIEVDLTNSEIELLNKYRRLSSYGKELTNIVIDKALEENKEEKP